MAFRDLLEQYVQQQQLENQVRRDTAEQFTPSAGQAANALGMLAPGAGIADAKGLYSSMPSHEQPYTEAFSNEPYPSMSENIANRNIFDASMQGLGVLGDATYGVPVLGAALGPTVGTALKGIGALGTVAKAAVKGKGIKALDKASKPSKKMSKADKIAALRAEANALRFGDETDEGIGSLNVDTSYRIQHQARGLEPDAIRLDDLTKDISGNQAGYPDNFYSSQGQRIYAPGKRFADDEYGLANTESYNAITKARGNPEAEVTIYRAVPKGIKNINDGDFVTLSPKYAELHGLSGYGSRGDEAGEVISQKVKVKDLIWDANDVNEFGYFPISSVANP